MSFNPGGGGGLTSASDVFINNPVAGQALSYDSSTLKWANTTIAKANVGLGSVDNTSDLNKPISIATQTALNSKAAISQSPPWLFATSATTLPARSSVVPAGYTGPVVVCTAAYPDFPDATALAVMQDGDLLLSRSST